MPQPPKLLKILQVLAGREVEFIVIGGVAAVLQGAAFSTFDLDIIHSRTPENIDRLLEALSDLQARYRRLDGSTLRPRASHLASPGHQLLMTSAGPLDLLGSVAGGESYPDLLPHCYEVQLGEATVRILRLESLISLKEKAGREKDRASLPFLRRALELKKQHGD